MIDQSQSARGKTFQTTTTVTNKLLLNLKLHFRKLFEILFKSHFGEFNVYGLIRMIDQRQSARGKTFNTATQIAKKILMNQKLWSACTRSLDLFKKNLNKQQGNCIDISKNLSVIVVIQKSVFPL